MLNNSETPSAATAAAHRAASATRTTAPEDFGARSFRQPGLPDDISRHKNTEHRADVSAFGYGHAQGQAGQDGAGPALLGGKVGQGRHRQNYKVNRIIPKLEKGEEIDTQPGQPKIMTGDFVVDEKHRNCTVTDVGWEKVEKLLGIGNIADPKLGAEASRGDRRQSACAL